ncbi:inhibitor of KinA [Inquilinus ginsengisoli]|uniref:5-oxoprolinase subunit PxpB n=1 Tax=Inquilinus ginsengisoli TaxID=363840 RepID=UPI003D1FEA02
MTAASIAVMTETAMVVRFGETIDPAIADAIHALALSLERDPFPGFVEASPGFATLAVFFDPDAVPRDRDEPPAATVQRLLEARLGGLDPAALGEPRLVEIPVAYGGGFGPDLAELAQHHGLTEEEVVALHSGAEYRVHMIGFSPGFPFLGGLAERLATPRRASPRLKIPAGTVAIGGPQTGIYPVESPGGWNLIGRTPLALFLPAENPPCLLAAGDRIRFRPIVAAEFEALAGVAK